MPNQRIVVEDLKAGRVPDAKYGKIAKQRSTSIRYRPDLAREMASPSPGAADDPQWGDNELAKLEDQKCE